MNCHGCRLGWERYENPQGIWLHRNPANTIGTLCERDTMRRFTIEYFEDAGGLPPWCVVDTGQTGSDGGDLLVGRYPNYQTAGLVWDACNVIAPHFIDCDMDEDCTCQTVNA